VRNFNRRPPQCALTAGPRAGEVTHTNLLFVVQQQALVAVGLAVDRLCADHPHPAQLQALAGVVAGDAGRVASLGVLFYLSATVSAGLAAG
jgi:hypothetical protein